MAMCLKNVGDARYHPLVGDGRISSAKQTWEILSIYPRGLLARDCCSTFAKAPTIEHSDKHRNFVQNCLRSWPAQQWADEKEALLICRNQPTSTRFQSLPFNQPTHKDVTYRRPSFSRAGSALNGDLAPNTKLEATKTWIWFSIDSAPKAPIRTTIAELSLVEKKSFYFQIAAQDVAAKSLRTLRWHAGCLFLYAVAFGESRQFPYTQKLYVGKLTSTYDGRPVKVMSKNSYRTTSSSDELSASPVHPPSGDSHSLTSFPDDNGYAPLEYDLLHNHNEHHQQQQSTGHRLRTLEGSHHEPNSAAPHFNFGTSSASQLGYPQYFQSPNDPTSVDLTPHMNAYTLRPAAPQYIVHSIPPESALTSISIGDARRFSAFSLHPNQPQQQQEPYRQQLDFSDPLISNRSRWQAVEHPPPQLQQQPLQHNAYLTLPHPQAQFSNTLFTDITQSISSDQSAGTVSSATGTSAGFPSQPKKSGKSTRSKGSSKSSTKGKSTGAGKGGAETAKERKFFCPEPGCGKGFSTSHSGDKPFSCSIPGCSSRFTRHDNMLQHYRTHLSRLPSFAGQTAEGGTATSADVASQPQSGTSTERRDSITSVSSQYELARAAEYTSEEEYASTGQSTGAHGQRRAQQLLPGLYPAEALLSAPSPVSSHDSSPHLDPGVPTVFLNPFLQNEQQQDFDALYNSSPSSTSNVTRLARPSMNRQQSSLVHSSSSHDLGSNFNSSITGRQDTSIQSGIRPRSQSFPSWGTSQPNIEVPTDWPVSARGQYLANLDAPLRVPDVGYRRGLQGYRSAGNMGQQQRRSSLANISENSTLAANLAGELTEAHQQHNVNRRSRHQSASIPMVHYQQMQQSDRLPNMNAIRPPHERDTSTPWGGMVGDASPRTASGNQGNAERRKKWRRQEGEKMEHGV
ncbi:hypothetical protein BC832DRAFT_541114 [Gaertneriomyces semiglobifer]|nr:hypothetical protein BC832DRAFT_541114 [Gaertneriomyces semiglobifer]